MRHTLLLAVCAGLLVTGCVAPAGPVSAPVEAPQAAEAGKPVVTVYRSPT